MPRPSSAVIVLSALLVAGPAAAFDYVVEGPASVRVSPDEELLTAGVLVATTFYALPLLVSGLAFGFAVPRGGDALTNKGTQLLFSAPPVINGALVGTHILDEMRATDAREGWATLPALLMWGATAGQVIGLGIVAASFILAPREPLLEGPGG